MVEDFRDRSVRHEFVRKVLGIVAAQILFTIAICAPFILVDEVKWFALDRQNSWIMWLCLAVTLALILVIGCIEYARRTYPLNLVLLMIFTFVESILVGFSVAPRYPVHVLMALGITFLLCTALILFALQTACDFTGLMPFLLIFSLVLVLAGIISIFFRSRIYVIVLSSITVLIFSIWLIVDIQIMLGGDHKYSIEPEDYIMAALSIYLDIITIFLSLLNIIDATFE